MRPSTSNKWESDCNFYFIGYIFRWPSFLLCGAHTHTIYIFQMCVCPCWYSKYVPSIDQQGIRGICCCFHFGSFSFSLVFYLFLGQTLSPAFLRVRCGYVIICFTLLSIGSCWADLQSSYPGFKKNLKWAWKGYNRGTRSTFVPPSGIFTKSVGFCVHSIELHRFSEYT